MLPKNRPPRIGFFPHFVYNRLKTYGGGTLFMRKKPHRRISVRTKLLCVFLTSVIIPLIVFGLFMFRTGSAKIENETAETYTQMTKQLSIIFSEYISRVDQITRMVDNTTDVPRYLRNAFTGFETDPTQVWVLEQNALEALKQIARTNEDIHALIVSTLDGQSLAFTGGRYTRPTVAVEDAYYAPLLSSTGNTVLLPVRTAHDGNDPGEAVFSVACKHLDVGLDDDIGITFYTGYVISECPVSRLAAICDDAPFGDGTLLYICDSSGAVVYTTDDNAARADAVTALHTAGDTRRRVALSGGDYFLTDSPVAETGWSVVAALPYTYVTRNTEDLIRRFIFLCLLAAAIITALTVIVSNSFTRPVRVLQTAMRQVGDGDLAVRIEERRNDEFGELYDGFNRLMKEIDQLIHTVSESEKRETVAKYQMLQSQINPHFLYNSLDTIRMMAVLDDKDDIAAALLHLSALFRYHVRNSDRPVMIMEELEQVNNYLALQKLRLQEKLQIVCDADPSLLGCYVPKILLQPILENCFSHGFRDAEDVCRITVSVKAEGDALRLSVADNGCGMDEETLKTLHARLRNPVPPGEHGIGLCNVNERLRLYFGAESCLHIESRKSDGTRISFRIPAIRDADALRRYRH